MEITDILSQIGLNERESAVYLKLLSSGACPLRKLQEATSLKRAQVLGTLKSLARLGLVTGFKKHKKEMYLAEDPERLVDLLGRRELALSSTRRRLAEMMSELKLLYAEGGNRPAIRHYEGSKGVALVLKDVLKVVSALSDRTYRAYSSSEFRECLYKEYPKFTKERIARKLFVRVIAAGSGGDPQPLSERRWLKGASRSGAYILIYGNRVAFVTMDASGEQPQATVIDDPGLASSQCLIFDQLWGKLGKD